MFGTRIIIADADVGNRKKIKEMLVQAGYMVTAEVGDGRSALKVIFQTEPDLVIMDSKLPGVQGLGIIRIIEENRTAPVILLIESHEQGLLEEVKDFWIFGCLPKPLSDAQLFPAIEIALANFKKFTKLVEENKRLKTALEERKLVEKAKGIVMEAKGLSEQEAYKYMQKLSMDKCVPIARIARSIMNHLKKS
jgi:response regulator NasT